MSITKTAFIISVFNVVSCTAFFLYRFLIFYEIVQLTKTDEINRYTVVSRREFNPNVTSYMGKLMNFQSEIIDKIMQSSKSNFIFCSKFCIINQVNTKLTSISSFKFIEWMFFTHL